VIRVDADGKGFVLLDTAFQEIRGLHFDDKGMLFVTAMNGRAGSTGAIVPPIADQLSGGGAAGRAPIPVVTVSTEITSIVVDVPDTTSGSSARDRNTTKGAVYRITPDGVWDQVWDSREDVPYDLTFDPSGAPIIATGNKGKLYASKAIRFGRRCSRARAHSR
jgi:hypothetical protein